LELLCTKLGFEPILFEAADPRGIRFYHTNVMMWIGSKVAAVCSESIADEQVRKRSRSCEDPFRTKSFSANFKQKNDRTILFSLRETAMRLRSQRPLHVQGDVGHPG
jgi:hypothetical protein